MNHVFMPPNGGATVKWMLLYDRSLGKCPPHLNAIKGKSGFKDKVHFTFI